MKNLICVSSNGFTAKDYSKILCSVYLVFVFPLMSSFMGLTMWTTLYMLLSVGERIAK